MKNTTQVTNVSIKEGPIQIGIATTPEEKREVYQLRYKVYAEEIGYKLEDVDHQNKLLYEDLDDWAILLTAHTDSKLIGTVRLNIGTTSKFPPDIVHAYRLDKFRKFYNENDHPHFTIISRGMVSPQYRSSATAYLFMIKMYELCCTYQVQFSFLECNFHLISFYEHTGLIRINKNTIDSHDGSPLASLVMVIDDIEHLRAVGSPLLRTARKKNSLDIKAVHWFHSELSNEIKGTVNSRIVSIEELWIIISRYLGKAPDKSLPLLRGLLKSEAKLFLHSCGSIVHCHKDDHITSYKTISQELIILLSGAAYSSKNTTISIGNYCGNNGLYKITKHSATVIALNDLDILVLSHYNFTNFKKRQPKIAQRILDNLHK